MDAGRRNLPPVYPHVRHEPLKILSIRRPWAYLITRGSKNIENRVWPTKYRGPLLIQASLTIDREACREHKLFSEELETGGVVGMAEIVDCVTEHHSRWFDHTASSYAIDDRFPSLSGRGRWGLETRQLGS